MFFSRSVNGVAKSAHDSMLEAELLEKKSREYIEQADSIRLPALRERLIIVRDLDRFKNINPRIPLDFDGRTFTLEGRSKDLLMCDQRLIDADQCEREAKRFVEAAAEARRYVENLTKAETPNELTDSTTKLQSSPKPHQ